MRSVRLIDIIDKLPRKIRMKVSDWVGETFFRIESEYNDKIREIASCKGHEVFQEEDYREARIYRSKIEERNLRFMRDKVRELLRQHKLWEPEEETVVSRSRLEYAKAFSYEVSTIYELAAARRPGVTKAEWGKSPVYLSSRKYGKEELPGLLPKNKIEIEREGKVESRRVMKEGLYAVI